MIKKTDVKIKMENNILYEFNVFDFTQYRNINGNAIMKLVLHRIENARDTEEYIHLSLNKKYKEIIKKDVGITSS